MQKQNAKKIHFISGLPRSGSTLLANILAQNPDFNATATSGIMDIIFGVRNSWDKLVEFKAHPDEEGKKRVMKGILENYYANVDKPVIFDKSRGWCSLLEMAEGILERKAKVLVPVRDIRDALASFEKLWRREAAFGQNPLEREKYFKFQTAEGRCDLWLSADQTLGLAYNRIRDALRRGFGDRMYFVEFEKLTSEPKKEMRRIYKFLGEEEFEHDFDNVKQVTWEDDSIHGIKGLHDIRQKVRPMDPQWKTVLGMFADQYSKLNFWWPENQAFHDVVYNWKT